MKTRILPLLLMAGLLAPAAAQAPAPGRSLKQIATIDLPGPPGKRFDYLMVVPEEGWLLANHLAAGLLYVIDLKTNKLIKAIADVPGAEGVEYVPSLKKAYTADWYENKVAVIDMKTMQVVKKIATEAKPDGMAYVSTYHKLFVSDERGKAEAIIDVDRDEVITTLHFESATGMPQWDSVGKTVWVNLQDQNTIIEIDQATNKVNGRWPVGQCKGNHGMALDTQNRRAFLVCESNDLMTVFDMEAHKTVAALAMPKGADVIKFDPGLKRIYVACSSGVIAVYHQDDADHYSKVEDFPVQPKVHSLAVDTRTHRLYAPEEQANGKPMARMVVYEAVK